MMKQLRQNVNIHRRREEQFIGVLRVVGAIVVLAMFTAACSKTGSGRLGKGTTTFTAQEGWINANTYQMVVYGQWDRSAYYEEETKPPANTFGLQPKPMFGLREDAKTAAKIRAMRNFKEKMVTYIQSASRVENAALVSDVVSTALKGVVIAPQSVKEEYSKRHDASITFHFEAASLKQIVDAAVQTTLNRFNEGSEFGEQAADVVGAPAELPQ